MRKHNKLHKAAWDYKCPDSLKEVLTLMLSASNAEHGKPAVDAISFGDPDEENTSARAMEISETTSRLVSLTCMSRGRTESRGGEDESRSVDREREAKRTKYDARPVNDLRKEFRSFQSDERLKEFDNEVKFDRWKRDVVKAVEVQFGVDWTSQFRRIGPHLSLAMTGTLREAFNLAASEFTTWEQAVNWLETLMQKELVSPEQRARTRLHSGEIRQGEGDISVGRYHHRLQAEFLKAGTLSEQEKLDLFRQNLTEETTRHAYVHAITGKEFRTMEEVVRFLLIKESTSQIMRKQQSAHHRMHRPVGQLAMKGKTVHPLATHRVHWAAHAVEETPITDEFDCPPDDAQVGMDLDEEWKDAPRSRHRNGSKHRGTRQRAFMAGAQRADGHDRPPQSKTLFTPDISKKDPSEPFWMNKQISCGQASWCQEAR